MQPLKGWCCCLLSVFWALYISFLLVGNLTYPKIKKWYSTRTQKCCCTAEREVSFSSLSFFPHSDLKTNPNSQLYPSLAVRERPLRKNPCLPKTVHSIAIGLSHAFPSSNIDKTSFLDAPSLTKSCFCRGDPNLK